MTKRKTQDLWSSEIDVLLLMANEDRARLLELRMQKSGSSLKNVKEMKKIKKRIARTLTILKEKSLNK